MLKKMALLSLIIFFVSLPGIPAQSISEDSIKSQYLKKFSLKECLEIALENNYKIKASKEGLKISEAQKKQAASGYWPQLSLKAAYNIMDQDPAFILPSFKMNLPLSFPGLNLNLTGIPVPEQDVKLMDKQNLHGELTLTYPLYTGGKVQSLNRQAEYGYKISNEEIKNTELEIKNDVTTYYYGVVLTKNLYKIGCEALERLEATLNLTESLYKNGSGKVTKIDYLRNKLIVDQVRSLILELKGKVETAKAALRFSLGGKAINNFDVNSEDIPNVSYKINADSITAEAYNYNPDWSKINSAIEIFRSKIDEAQSGYLPAVGLFGSLNQNINSYNYGIVNKDNRTMWTVGLGLEMPIFSGFRTSGEVDEAKARLKKTMEDKNLLHEAILLQVKNACNDITTAEDQLNKILEAKNTAEENRSLNERAFQQDMVEAKDLVEAQIMESFVQAEYQKALYDHLMAQAKLEMILGKNINDN